VFALLIVVQLLTSLKQDGVSRIPQVSDLDFTPTYKDLKVKAHFQALCSPDEILKMLLDHNSRSAWDYSVEQASRATDSNSLRVEYTKRRGA